MRTARTLTILAAITTLLAVAASAAQQPRPPVAKKVPHTTTIHGRTLVDNYYWLREKTNPEVIDYLKAETAYADAMMRGSEAFQTTLYNEMLGRIKQTDVEVPYRQGGYFYYTRTEEGKQYPIYCRKKGSVDATEEVTLDQNAMAVGLPFLSIRNYRVSDDGNLLAYTTDTTGFRQYALHVKDLRTGEVLADTAERVTSLSWSTDNRTLFYTQEDAVTKRSHKMFRHELGATADTLLYEEKDELFDLYSYRTLSRGFVVAVSASSTTSECRYLAADHPADPLRVFLPRKTGVEYYIDHSGDRFYVRTNDTGKTYRLVTAPVADPKPENWREVIPMRKDVMLEDVDCFASFYVVHEREQGVPKLLVTDIASGASHFIEFPEPVYVVGSGDNLEFASTDFRLVYESLVTPSSVYDYDTGARKLKLLKRDEVLGGYDPDRYRSERIYATAADGVKVPISLVYRKDLVRDGKRPMLLGGYGSYGYPYDVDFSSNRLSLLDRGVIFAIAHIRGGGELGKDWHDQGKMMTKKNTFTDFIASAEFLVAQKYTSSDRLVITGGSAGGLLMGAVTNMRPDLFKAVVAYVPYVDVINTMLDETLPLTVGEFLEWGNPKERAAFDYMISYSPYDNIAAKNYPAMLVRTSLNDSQVMYWEPAKYVAKLRTLKTDANPLLLRTNMEAGHGGKSGRFERYREIAEEYAFVLLMDGRR